MLGVLRARRCADERRSGPPSHRIRRSSAVDAAVAEPDVTCPPLPRGLRVHDLRRGGALADGLLLHAQANDEPGDLRRAELAAHDLAHHVQHLVVEHLAVLHRALDRLGDGDLFHVLAPWMKFCSSLWPCSVSRASGWNCTPSTSSWRWRSPMISPSSDSALTSRQAGNDERSTTSEW